MFIISCLSEHEQRTMRISYEITVKATCRFEKLIGMMHLDGSLPWQGLHIKVVQRFGEGHVDVDRPLGAPHACLQSLVHESVAIPVHLVMLFAFAHLGQRHRLSHHFAQGMGLRKRLTVHLPYPLLGSICRNHDKRNLLIIGLSHGWIKIQQSRARCHAYHDRLETFSHRKA